MRVPPVGRLFLSSIVALSALRASAQDSPPEVSVIQPAAEPAAPASSASAAAEPAKGKSPEEQRLADLLKLKFDRSPASILDAQAKLADGSAPADKPLELFRIQVVAGRWNEVGAFLKTLPGGNATKVYEFLLKDLDRVSAPAAGPQQQQQVNGPTPTPTLLPLDVAELADLAPAALNEPQLKLLSALLKRVSSSNASLDPLLRRIDEGTVQLGGADPAKRSRAAQLLLLSGRPREASKLLAPLEAGQEAKSFPLLEHHIQSAFGIGRQEKDDASIAEGWRLNQLLLAAENCPPEFRQRAWRRVADIARFLPAAASAEGIREFFVKQPQHGPTLLKAIATQVSDDRSSREPDLRKRNMEMQRHVAEAMLALPDRRAQWQPAIDLFATNWMEEADYSKRLYVPPRNQNMQFDDFGNQIFYSGQSMQSQPQQTNSNQLPPIPIAELVPLVPGAAWLDALNPSLRPRALSVLADLHLKLEDDAKALPYVEQLATLQPKEAVKLANSLLRAWASARDPQRSMPQRRPGMMYYGPYGPQQQQGIPLTRALQQRNLEELSILLQRLRGLPMPPLEDAAIVAAFTIAHSQAEVFREESIELALGKVEQVKPETLSELLQAMRQRLAGQWRKPGVQQQAKTQRNDAQIDAEVLRGYELLAGLTQKGLAREPDSWRLNLVQAATLFDWAEFQYGKKVDLKVYVEKRENAFAAFQRAANLYAAALPSMEQKDETPAIYQQWLNANLGASDLAFVTRQQEASGKNIEGIRNAILALPGGAAERHFQSLSKAITGGANTLPANLKPAYMRAALQVMGDRPDAEEIRKLVTYYDGLLREIEVSVRIDGDATVGHTQPFGVFFTVRHTAELERENAGGFGKYLRNQSQNPYYSSPFGIAPVDHRDELEKQMREKLIEGFDILSITFHDEKVQSRGYGRAGWRETPLVYLLLKAKDASVDRLPSLRLDADFVDRYGPAVLPIESPVVLLDARPTSAPTRPLAEMEVTQILDDRAVKEGKLALEIKATAKGIVPPFEQLFDFAPAGFNTDELTDSGPAMQRFDSAGDELAGVAERNWIIKLSANSSAAESAQ
ncbi:MAG TPA: hypothetical protein VGO90_17855, partial [Chthoniobacteraceae bacterium]|nr:hypothetical protein [Chthoniobacteraceae bacterium]